MQIVTTDGHTDRGRDLSRRTSEQPGLCCLGDNCNRGVFDLALTRDCVVAHRVIA